MLRYLGSIRVSSCPGTKYIKKDDSSPAEPPSGERSDVLSWLVSTTLPSATHWLNAQSKEMKLKIADWFDIPNDGQTVGYWGVRAVDVRSGPLGRVNKWLIVVVTYDFDKDLFALKEMVHDFEQNA